MLAKTTTKLFLVGILLSLFLYNFEFELGFLYFYREVFDILKYKTYFTDIIVCHLNFLWKSFQWLPLCFSYSYNNILTRLFLSGAKKISFKRNKFARRKCCQLKALKVLLMYLFVTLLTNKIPGSDNRHFLLNILKNENKEEFLTDSTFYTFELIEKSILRKWQS